MGVRAVVDAVSVSVGLYIQNGRAEGGMDCVVPGMIGFVGGFTGLYTLPWTLGLTVAYIVATEDEA